MFISLSTCLLASLTHVLPFLSLPPLESLCSELITAGAVPSLVSSLSFPLSSVQTSIAEALSMLACDTTARDQVGGRRERERELGDEGGRKSKIRSMIIEQLLFQLFRKLLWGRGRSLRHCVHSREPNPTAFIIHLLLSSSPLLGVCLHSSLSSNLQMIPCVKVQSGPSLSAPRVPVSLSLPVK